jgi:hypothetical protein
MFPDFALGFSLSARDEHRTWHSVGSFRIEVKQRPDHPLTVVVAASGDRRKASRRQNLLPLITVSCADPVGLSRETSTALNEADSGWVSRVKRFSLKDRAFVMQRAGYMGLAKRRFCASIAGL